MSRLPAYINKDRMEREDVDMLMQDDSVSIDILRMPDDSEDAGFREQDPPREYTRIATVTGRIDRRNTPYNATRNETGSVVDALYIATIYYKDLRTGDRLVANRQTYEVRFVNKVGQSFTEAEVEVQT